MKKVIEKVNNLIKEIDKKELLNRMIMLGLCTSIMALNAHAAYAGLDTGKLSAFDDIIDFILSLVTKLGIGVGVWGGIDVALSFKSDSPEQKDKGMKLLLSGVALICVGASASYFKSL